MFYEIQIPEPKPGTKKISALVVLNPSESRRLLAKATVATPEVQNAWKNGIIIIGRGITNAYVTEELFRTTVEPKAGQTVGLICNGFANSNAGPPPCPWHVIHKGKSDGGGGFECGDFEVRTRGCFHQGRNRR